MKKLSELYKNHSDILINDIKINSKEVAKGDLFVCINGVNVNRNDFITDAIENGASAIVTNKDLKLNIPVIKVDNPNDELVKLCKKFYDFKRKDFKIIGVTGTNGKTTVASIIKDMIGDSCGYIGTNGIISKRINKRIKNTTPGADRLYKYFKELKKDGCNIISMETSSEAFYWNRLAGIKYDIGIVTNVTEDHLNVHKTLKNYIKCKEKLVKNVKDNGYSILNIDDKYYDIFKCVSKGKILTYGKKESTLQIINYKEYIDKTEISLKYNNNIYNIISPLTGEYNIYNLCAAILALIALNYNINEIIDRINNITIPNGRCEFLNFGQKFNIVLDYAHTTDAFLKLYKFLNKVRKGRLITVTGSAGGREKEKRGSMGKVILDNSDYVIFTMDDPRYEDVNEIINDLVSKSNKKNYERIINREEAIKKAFEIADENDTILIAGKGRDNYMAIEDKYIEYNDYDVIKKYLSI